MPTLTSWETQAMKSNELNLADGHAYQEFPSTLSTLINKMPEIWHRASNSSFTQTVDDFRHAWCQVSGTTSLLENGIMRLCPTASNSLDIVAAWCQTRNLTVGLIEPTFDNLALLFRRRKVPLVPIEYFDFLMAAKSGEFKNFLLKKRFDVLLLVNPNNPTGTDFLPDELYTIASWCKKNNIILIMDNTFRHFRRTPYDDAFIVQQADIDYIFVEDTGKTWPTLDTKVSALFYSEGIRDLTVIYEEQYLCASKFVTAFMTEILNLTREIGLKKIVWDLVDSRRKLLRAAIEKSSLSIAPESLSSSLPVEWLDCSRIGPSDYVAKQCRELFGIHILPGDGFYWANSIERDYDIATEFSRVRISFCKPESVFNKALNIFQSDYFDSELC